MHVDIIDASFVTLSYSSLIHKLKHIKSGMDHMHA
jgi:hypothetical protein